VMRCVDRCKPAQDSVRCNEVKAAAMPGMHAVGGLLWAMHTREHQDQIQEPRQRDGKAAQSRIGNRVADRAAFYGAAWIPQP
jgi:hypothetical protein